MPAEPRAGGEPSPEPRAETVDASPGAETVDASASATPAGGDDAAVVEQLRAELAEARERAERYHANWQRSAADFQNWKRRVDQEKAELTKLAEAGLAGELLRVLDDFERAFGTIPPELRTLTWVEGVALIWQKLFAILQAHGLSPIEALGRDFDPYLHEAVLREEDGEPSELTSVVAELQRGYRFGDRVLRATLVKVGKPREQPVGEQPAGGDRPSADEEVSAAGAP